MLGLFRNNQLYTVFFLALLTVLLRFPAFAGWLDYQPSLPENAGVLFRLLFSAAIQSSLLSASLATVLVFSQALLVKWLANESRINPDRNWFPALFTLIVMSSINAFQFLSPALVASTWIPLVLKRIFSIHKSNDITLTIFDTGLLVGISSLFYLPSLWLTPIFLIAIFSLRTLKLAEVASYIVAVFTPWVIAWGMTLLFTQNLPGLDLAAIFNWLSIQPEILDIHFWISSAILALLFSILLLSTSTFYRKRLIQVQKFNNILFWLIFGTVFSVLFNRAFDFSHILLAASALGVFLGLSFLSIQNKLVAEVFFFLLLAGMLLGSVPESLSQYQLI